MALASSVLHVAFLVACVFVVVIAYASARSERVRRSGWWLTQVTALTGLTGLLVRTAASGHLPLFGTFENTWACAVAIMLFVVIAPRLDRSFASMWRWMTPWSVLLLVYGMNFRSEPVALTISEQSVWVDVHVAFAWFGFVCLLAASTLSLLRLVGRQPLDVMQEERERMHDRLLFLGYLAFTTMLTVGAFYLWVLFATLWRWEIVGTASLLVWLLYGMLIHGRLFHRWNGRWYHAGVLGVLPVLLLAYWVWSVFPGTYHFFDIPLVRPY